MAKGKRFVQLTQQLLPHQDFMCGRGVKPSTDANCSAAAVTLSMEALHKKAVKEPENAYITSRHNHFLDFHLLTSFDGYGFRTLRVLLPHLRVQGRFLWLSV